jgi:hypothetical protein
MKAWDSGDIYTQWMVESQFEECISLLTSLQVWDQSGPMPLCSVAKKQYAG